MTTKEHFDKLKQLSIEYGVPEHWKNLFLENIENEEWKPIKNFEGLYEISNMGRVKSVKGRWGAREAIVKPQLSHGYPTVGLYKHSNGRISKKFGIHILVARHFIDNPENKPEVNHLKGIRWDNRHTELEWSTGLENQRHSWEFLNRRSTKGSRHAKAQLTEAQIPEIRKLLSTKTRTEVAKMYSVSWDTIRCIAVGRSWTHV